MNKSSPLPMGRKVPLIPCPYNCELKVHPVTMKNCPITGKPLGGSHVVPEAKPTTGPTVAAKPGRGARARAFIARIQTQQFDKIAKIAGLMILVVLLVYGLTNLSDKATVPGAGSGNVPGSEEGPLMVPLRGLAVDGKKVWMDVYEVTVGEFSHVMHREPSLPKHFRKGHPVVNVSYQDAQAYAAKVHKRLCTEREWKFAAGLEDSATTPDLKRAVTNASPDENLHLTLPQDRRYKVDRSDLGVVNLLGNVREWIAPSETGGPQYIGGAWSDTAVDAKRVREPIPDPTGAPQPTIGFRCCSDEAP